MRKSFLTISILLVTNVFLKASVFEFVGTSKTKDNDKGRITNILREKNKILFTIPNPNPFEDSIFYTFGINGLSDEEAQTFKSLGVTSVETYVTWESCESKGEGEWDWDRWDEIVETLKRNDLKWVPFLILGPAYSTPDWFRKSDEHIPSRCLEHGKASKIESLWNPNLPKRIERFIKTFAERYRDEGVIESILLGIQGDFGEAIYSVYGGGWTFNIPGKYHNHAGYWCNDIFALRSFRKYFKNKYPSLDSLNASWGTSYERFNEVNYPGYADSLRNFIREIKEEKHSKSKRQWLDFVEWYRSSMTDWSEWWIKTTRKYFPRLPIYLCTGGNAIPEHGSNFAEQVRVASKYNAGVRITNEASNYAKNFAVTRWVASAGKHYGSYYGFEPAGAEDEKGIVARIYNATCSGANQLHDYATNVTQTLERKKVQQENIKYLRREKPLVNVALWYPNESLTLGYGNEEFLQKAARLRSYADFDYVDGTMLHTNALESYKILVILQGDIMEKDDANIIDEWVSHGGRVIVMNVTHIRSIEGSNKPEELLFGYEGNGKDNVFRVEDWNSLNKRINKIRKDLKLPFITNKRDKVFCTHVSENEWLVLNMGDKSASLLLNTSSGSYRVNVNGNAIKQFVLSQ